MSSAHWVEAHDHLSLSLLQARLNELDLGVFVTQNTLRIQSVAQTIARPARALNRTSIDILAYDLVKISSANIGQVG